MYTYTYIPIAFNIRPSVVNLLSASDEIASGTDSKIPPERQAIFLRATPCILKFVLAHYYVNYITCTVYIYYVRLENTTQEAGHKYKGGLLKFHSYKCSRPHL